jgi:hypothetical protein
MSTYNRVQALLTGSNRGIEASIFSLSIQEQAELYSGLVNTHRYITRELFYYLKGVFLRRNENMSVQATSQVQGLVNLVIPDVSLTDENEAMADRLCRALKLA